MPEYHKKLARILRADQKVLLDLEEKMSKITGKNGVLGNIVEENDLLIRRTLEELGLDRRVCRAEEAYKSLVDRLVHIDGHLFDYLDRPDLSVASGNCNKLCEVALGLNNPGKGFFIKKMSLKKLSEDN